jgi:diacylglycerol kinase
MIDFFKTRALSFRYAFGGWWYVIRTQRNAWIHAIVSICVIGISIWLGLNRYDWALIIISIAIVWTAEFINTALEAIVDLTSPEQHELARISKDVGASSVLIAAGSAALIGFIILGPPLWARLSSLYK